MAVIATPSGGGAYMICSESGSGGKTYKRSISLGNVDVGEIAADSPDTNNQKILNIVGALVPCIALVQTGVEKRINSRLYQDV